MVNLKFDKMHIRFVRKSPSPQAAAAGAAPPVPPDGAAAARQQMRRKSTSNSSMKKHKGHPNSFYYGLRLSFAKLFSMYLLIRMDVIISLPLPTDEADDLGLLRDAAQLVAARQVQDVQDERLVQVQHGQLRAAPAAHAQGRVQAVPEQDGERLEQDQPGAQHQADLMKTLCITWRQKEKKNDL